MSDEPIDPKEKRINPADIPKGCTLIPKGFKPVFVDYVLPRGMHVIEETKTVRVPRGWTVEFIDPEDPTAPATDKKP